MRTLSWKPWPCWNQLDPGHYPIWSGCHLPLFFHCSSKLLKANLADPFRDKYQVVSSPQMLNCPAIANEVQSSRTLFPRKTCQRSSSSPVQVLQLPLTASSAQAIHMHWSQKSVLPPSHPSSHIHWWGSSHSLLDFRLCFLYSLHQVFHTHSQGPPETSLLQAKHPSSDNLSLYAGCSTASVIFVAPQRTHSNMSMSLFYWVAKRWTPHSKCVSPEASKE